MSPFRFWLVQAAGTELSRFLTPGRNSVYLVRAYQSQEPPRGRRSLQAFEANLPDTRDDEAFSRIRDQDFLWLFGWSTPK